MSRNLRILLIEDNPGDADLIKEMLNEADVQFELKCAERLSAGVEQIKAESFDVILLDLGLPDSQGLGTLMSLNEIKLEAPVIVLTGLADEDLGTRAVKEGAQDYLFKGQIDKNMLVRSINYSIERKRAQDELAAERTMLRTLIDTIPDLIWLKDCDGVFLASNPEFERFFGAPESDIIGKTDYDYVDRELADFFRENDRKAMAAGVPVANEEWITYASDGHRALLETVKTPMYDSKGQLKGVLGIARDITVIKQTEEELHKKNTEIEQFIYTVSHDLRSPLVTVKTFMGYLEKDIVEDNQEQLTQDIKFIHNAADKMKLLLDELLELSRIGRIESSPVRVSLQEVLAEVLDVLAGIITERTADIRLPDSDLMLFCDHPRLCQIWQNLIENAIKYSCEGSIPRIELGIQELSGETTFFVKDYGIGVDPRYSSKIFGIFEKLDAKSPGAGMGLSLVQRIVEKSGGRVWVESEGSNKGSCFYFTLPQAMVKR
ncbi:MAG: PAS domain S-box protein [Desulfuromonadales bacterium]|nr:PAS domain S-box protein [Desulfuromonadales bacterium]